MIRLRYILTFLSIALLCAVAATAQAHGPHKDDKEPKWFQELNPEQREEARRIVSEASPRLRELRKEMRAKMKELKAFAYSKDEDHETLPRLGRQLQDLREELRRELQALDEKLQREVGASFKSYKGRSCVNLSRRPSHTESVSAESEQ